MSKWEKQKVYMQLKDVADFSNKKIDTKLLNINNYISTENMLPEKEGVIKATSIPSNNKQSRFSEGNILLSNIRPYFKKIWYANKIGGCSNDVLVLEVKKEIVPKFLYYVLSDNNFFNYSTITSKGTKMPRGSKDAIMKYLVPNISKFSQERIVDILSTYDDLIENNNRRIDLMEKSAQDLYKEWFVRFRFPNYENTKFLNGLPEGWEYFKLGDLAEIEDGDRGVNYPKKDEFSSDEYCIFLNAGNVTKNGFDFSLLNCITREKDSILRKGKLKKNDVVLTSRGTVGNCAFYNENIRYSHIRINSGMVILRALGHCPPEYIYTVLNSGNMIKLMELFSSGSAQPQLPIKDMKRLKVLISDKDTLENFANHTQYLYKLISQLREQNQTLKKQRDLLLPRLLCGKLEV